ncbi:Uncaracterized surface protein containing fasciclin (FAS1) repeats [Flavobacterium omnivorum]|uniref:Uncaracterized surface protein containing fasciclin (FAS1) repeats n=1 Tax=Flavobacterium omnivorum TaxID=178355 RepID=A0A1G8CUC0_9FLAO|nr:fasciclin domain-containing protein [Flavobacterium omnivorum]SDH49091.1 Uncaracterized surface protein containing fasciclin (FAS1) repeats [Flavobacterium omnivorum]
MKTKKIISSAILAIALFTGISSFAQNVVEVAVGSENHTTLVAAVKAAGLVDTLTGAGPFTVFAPTNAAFDKLPTGTVASLLEPANLKTLQGILTYHVVAGKIDSKAVVAAIKAGKGKAVLTTVQGGTLTASLKGENVIVTDEKGGVATITAVDLDASNGIIHVIDTVLMHK